MTSLGYSQNGNAALIRNSPGFRLYKLEVLNWGTFDRKVWTFSPRGETALLTGDVGSGKSTLVDAMTTLLVSPRKVAYNKAADSSAKERTITSYVRGYFGLKKGSEGTGQPECLRNINSYSVLLATFVDWSLSQYVTLAQFFWFQAAKNQPERFYVVADRELSIIQDFSNFEKNVRVLKSRLKSQDDIQVFDDYNRYSLAFRPKLGIAREQALDLFQQTISMKKVEALTEFVRTNMLEDPHTIKDVDKLIEHFHDLNSAHEAVLKAKDQIARLQPIIEQGNRHACLAGDQGLLESAVSAVEFWFAAQKATLQVKNILSLEQKLTLLTAKREEAEVVQEKIEDDLREVDREINANGGDAIRELEKEIQIAKGEQQRLQKALDSYSDYAKELKLSIPNSMETFVSNKSKIPELESSEEELQDSLQKDLTTAITEKSKLQTELEGINGELESLRSRKSSIPRDQIEKRRQLCKTLTIAEDELPFVGELLEVRKDEEKWEGAIERLLHNFALSMLVPEKYYPAVAQWVDKTSLGIRLVYYRVGQEKAQPFYGQVNPLSAAAKLNIKPSTAFGVWLTKELQQRFSHVCCENMEQFRREQQAITKFGQIKSRGNRHEKDDRSSINDRRHFVLGFSNQRKIDALEKSRSDIVRDQQFYENEIQEARSKQRDSQRRIDVLGRLRDVADFAEIDVRSVENTLQEKRVRKAALEKGNDLLDALRIQRDELEDKHKKQKGIIKCAYDGEAGVNEQLKQAEKEQADSQELAKQASPLMLSKAYPYLDQHKSEVFNSDTVTLGNADKLRRRYSSWLDAKKSKVQADLKSLGEKIVRGLTDYTNHYKEETKEIDSSIESLPEFEKILKQLEEDGLPKFETRFKQLLHENTINQIALFQAKLKQAQDIMKERIDRINASLSTIDYNDGRYIRLEYDETYDSEIKAFRVQLKSCTEGALTGSEDEQYAEAKFLQVKAIIERFQGRPGETESDARWTKKVIDVRNWFLFAASERWRDTDEEYEHYTDSGGKSGGQKEKLAYTILAASLVYHFGLEEQQAGKRSFRFVVIDEAFLKSSDESARYGLQLFKNLDLQLMIVTPLLKIPIIAQFIAHVGFVHHNDVRHESMLRNISIDEYEREREEREAVRSVQMV